MNKWWNGSESNLSNLNLLINKIGHKNSRLGIFVGNGLSRFSGAPSWEGLFQSKEIQNFFSKRGINVKEALDKGLHLELASIIFRDSNKTIENIFSEAFLSTWVRHAETLSAAHWALRFLCPSTVLTVNIDNLLSVDINPQLPTSHDPLFRDVKYLHGSEEDKSKWILSSENYRRYVHEVKEIILEKVQNVDAMLFVGYGFSYYDSDIIEAIATIQDNNLSNKLYALLPDSEYNQGMLKGRLDKFGIRCLTYSLPVYPTIVEREVAMTRAILEIVERANKTVNVDISPYCQASMEKYKKNLNDIKDVRNNPTLIIGLASRNTISMADEVRGFPILQRSTLRRKLYTEPGGPGFIVARILAYLNCPVVLASSIMDDDVGREVLEQVKDDRDKYPLFLDMLLKKTIIDPLHHTHDSYVLVDKDSGQRVFLDYPMDYRRLGFDDKTREDLNPECIKTKNIYFDRFIRQDLAKIVNSYTTQDNECWTYYETGERGDYNESYQFEYNQLHHQVNFATSSFHFAFHYFGQFLSTERINDDPSSDIAQKIKKIQESFTTLLNDKTSVCDLNDAEQKLLIESIILDDGLLKNFCDWIAYGAHRWLRKHDVRCIVVTLHSLGCLYLILDKSGNVTDYQYLTTNKDISKVINTASAGDTFRGGFVAWMIKARQDSDFKLNSSVEKACHFANLAAYTKCHYITVEQALPAIEKLWKEAR